MEFEYSSFRNNCGRFYHPSINVSFKYKNSKFQYQDALVDTGSDYVLLPFEIAERIGAEPDLEDYIELNCACGGGIKAYATRYPIEISIDHVGFRPKNWQTHARLVDANITPLLGHRGFLDRFDVKFYGKKHVMELKESK